MTTAQIRMPKKMVDLFLDSADIRVAWGGRGSGKTRTMATMCAVKGYQLGMQGVTGQILCLRQYMNSLADSSLSELKRAIEDVSFLNDYYEIGENYIKSRDGRIAFTFAGLDRNISSIKSKGRILLAWIDEAEAVTEYAYSVLIPTLREAGEGWSAELYISYNPASKGSATHKRFRGAPPNPRVKIVEISWQDNPYFPDLLNRTRLDDLDNRPDNYDHVWLGAFGSIQGAILGKWVAKARREERITDDIVFDPEGAPIEVSGDLGFRDTAAWWYWQRVPGGFNVLKYEGDSGLDAEDWIPRIQESVRELGCTRLGKVWLPHDSRAKTFQSKHTSMEKFLSAFGASKVGLVPQSKKLDQISAARTVIDRCAFNLTLCEDGIEGLEAWEFDYNKDTEIYSKEPLHNWACFVAGTTVSTEQGCRAIESLSPGDMVETPRGLRKVIALHCYQASKLVELSMGDGQSVICTPEHKFFTARGLVPADALSYDDVLFTGKELIWQLISMVAGTTGMHQVITDSFQQESRPLTASSVQRCIVTSGSITTDLYRMGMRYITWIMIKATTIYRTCSAYPEVNISDCMGRRAAISQHLGTRQKPVKSSTQSQQGSNGLITMKECLRKVWQLCQKQGRQLKNGMAVLRVSLGIQRMGRKHGKIASCTKKLARFAVRLLLRIGRIKLSIAGRIVELKRFDAEQSVYDLTVEHDHCFIANGLLTSNSHPSDAFAYGCQMMQEYKLADEPEPTVFHVQGHAGRIVTATLDEMWAAAPKKSHRI